jgi:hypothetical protein
MNLSKCRKCVKCSNYAHRWQNKPKQNRNSHKISFKSRITRVISDETDDSDETNHTSDSDKTDPSSDDNHKNHMEDTGINI